MPQDPAWVPVRVERPRGAPGGPDEEAPNILHFRNGRQLRTGLYEVEYLGQLLGPGHAPRIVLGGRGCHNCDIETEVFIVLADVGDVPKDPPHFYYPGSLTSQGSDTAFYRGRLFLGRCLDPYRSAAVWLQSERDSTGGWHDAVFVASADADTLQERFLKPPLPTAASMRRRVTAGSCHEVPGRGQLRF